MPEQAGRDSTQEMYARRFGERERAQKNALWEVLCRSFFQRYVSESDVVLDLGAGYCEFINNIRCGRKIAVDANEDSRSYAADGVTVIVGTASDLSSLEDASVDVAFASNLFEHLPSKQTLVAVLGEVRRVLRAGGRLLILQPNIRYAFREYWDYFDHYLPLSHLSLAEVLELEGFKVDEVRPRFLPYTVKSRFPKSPLLVRLYLALPPLQALLGKQMFLVASKV